jgi:acetoin utilization deacetylase AcuC-like enzyme
MSPARVPVLVASLAGDDRHDTGPWHPENQSRLDAVDRALRAPELADVTAPLAIRDATTAELVRVHDERYLDALAQVSAAGGADLDPDTVASPGSWGTALRAAGAGLAAVEALDRGEADAAFVAIRPPGHHALPARAMGFCLLNNVAVAAAALAERGERVAIVDWDVHHGNGTQDIFWDDPRVLYVSTHQWPAYPGTGRATETGGPSAPGLTVNVPPPPGATGDVAMAALDDAVAPVVDRFSPTWVLVSAGFDAHRDDPLADLRWSSGDYAALARKVAQWVPVPGRVVAFLEGGYDLGALQRSVTATVAAFAGAAHDAEPQTNGGPGLELVSYAARVQAKVAAEGG